MGKSLKFDSTELFEKNRFKVHKWHSNEPNLETNYLVSQTELNFAKKHLATKGSVTNIQELNWDKQKDTFRVEIPTESQLLTKRNMLKTLVSIYDALVFMSPVLLISKLFSIYII